MSQPVQSAIARFRTKAKTADDAIANVRERAEKEHRDLDPEYDPVNIGGGRWDVTVIYWTRPTSGPDTSAP